MVAPRRLPADDGRDIYENGDGDFRGYYEDGAYVATTLEVNESAGSDETEELQQQVRYFDSILSRFKALQNQLQQMPPLEVLEKLGPDSPTHVARLNVSIAKFWRWNMRTVDPKPAQVASMDKETILRLLGLLTSGALLKRGIGVDAGVSRWAWSLLARLPDRGELTSEEIGVVRQLGKRAVLVATGLREDSSWEQGIKEVERDFNEEDSDVSIHVANEDEIALGTEYDENESLDVTDMTVDMGEANTPPSSLLESVIPGEASDISNDDKSKELNLAIGGNGTIGEIEPNHATEKGKYSLDNSDDSNLAAAKARILGQLQTPEGSEDPSLIYEEQKAMKEIDQNLQAAIWNSRATVDMIITVAGEVFGQRDLLEFRGAWEG